MFANTSGSAFPKLSFTEYYSLVVRNCAFTNGLLSHLRTENVRLNKVKQPFFYCRSSQSLAYANVH